MDSQFYPPEGELPLEIGGNWLLPPSEVTVTSESLDGTSNTTVQPSLFAATSYYNQDEHQLNPDLSYISQESFNDGHYNLPSSYLSFSLPSHDSHSMEAPLGPPFDMGGDSMRREVSGWPFDISPFDLPSFDGPPFNGPPFTSRAVHDEQEMDVANPAEEPANGAGPSDPPPFGVPSTAHPLSQPAQALDIPSQADVAMEDEPANHRKRRREDSDPPSVVRQSANPAMPSNSPFSDSPLPPRPQVGVPIDRLNIVIPDALNTARAASTDWVRGWQMLLGAGMTVEASTVAVTVSDQFPTVDVTRELDNFRETVRKRRRTLMEEIPEQDRRRETREEEDAAVQRIVNAEQGLKGNKAVTDIAHQKVHGSVKKLAGFVIDLIKEKDCLGLAEYDDDDCKNTLKMLLGWVATTMYHTHLYLTHRRCSGTKLTDFQHLSMYCPMAGEILFTWIEIAGLEGALQICRTFSFARMEQTMALEDRQSNVKAIDSGKTATTGKVKPPRKPKSEKKRDKAEAKAKAKGKGRAKAVDTDVADAEVISAPTASSSSHAATAPSSSHAATTSSSSYAATASSSHVANASSSAHANTPSSSAHAFNPAFNISSASLMPFSSSAAFHNFNMYGNPFACAPQADIFGPFETQPTLSQQNEPVPASIPVHEPQPTAPRVISIPSAEEDAANIAGPNGEIVYHADAEPTSEKHKGPRRYMDGFLRARLRSGPNQFFDQDILGTAMNFHGALLHKTANRLYHLIDKEYIDPRTGESPVKSFYKDQSNIAPGSKHDYVYRAAILPSAIASCVLQVMYDKATLNITADQVMTDPNAILTLESKIQTARTQMEAWMRRSPKEHNVFRGRFMNMFGVINAAHPIGDHSKYSKDINKTFIPGNSDHLAIPGQSWTDRNPPSGVSHPDTERMRRQLLQSLPETRHIAF